MKLEILKKERIEDFKNYCKKYRQDVDDSFLCDEDLNVFELNDENPTYIITNENDEIVAAASLLIDDYHKKGRKGRFRILHSEINRAEYYELLMEGILKHTAGLERVIIFIPTHNQRLQEDIKALNFQADRYSFVLVRDELDVPSYDIPEDYSIRTFKQGRDEATWCKIRNIAFSNLKGSETPITPDMVNKMVSNHSYIEGGLAILYHKDMPVGVVRGEADIYMDAPIMNIGPLAIVPEYQGKGLGRILLRYIINFARDKEYGKTMLCVNAENETAKRLYIQEGFKQVEAVVCYQYDLYNNTSNAKGFHGIDIRTL